MKDLQEAIDFYHSLLDDEIGERSQDQLTRQLHHRQLFFGERPLCTVLRPRFLTADLYHMLQQAIRQVMPAFTRVHLAALENLAVRSQLGLAAWEEELVHIDPGFSAYSLSPGSLIPATI